MSRAKRIKMEQLDTVREDYGTEMSAAALDGDQRPTVVLSTIETLPCELLFLILEHLDFTCLLNLRICCKRFHSMLPVSELSPWKVTDVIHAMSKLRASHTWDYRGCSNPTWVVRTLVRNIRGFCAPPIKWQLGTLCRFTPRHNELKGMLIRCRKLISGDVEGHLGALILRSFPRQLSPTTEWEVWEDLFYFYWKLFWSDLFFLLDYFNIPNNKAQLLRIFNTWLYILTNNSHHHSSIPIFLLEYYPKLLSWDADTSHCEIDLLLHMLCTNSEPCYLVHALPLLGVDRLQSHLENLLLYCGASRQAEHFKVVFHFAMSNNILLEEHFRAQHEEIQTILGSDYMQIPRASTIAEAASAQAIVRIIVQLIYNNAPVFYSFIPTLLSYIEYSPLDAMELYLIGDLLRKYVLPPYRVQEAAAQTDILVQLLDFCISDHPNLTPVPGHDPSSYHEQFLQSMLFHSMKTSNLVVLRALLTHHNHAHAGKNFPLQFCPEEDEMSTFANVAGLRFVLEFFGITNSCLCSLSTLYAKLRYWEHIRLLLEYNYSTTWFSNVACTVCLRYGPDDLLHMCVDRDDGPGPALRFLGYFPSSPVLLLVQRGKTEIIQRILNNVKKKNLPYQDHSWGPRYNLWECVVKNSDIATAQILQDAGIGPESWVDGKEDVLYFLHSTMPDNVNFCHWIGHQKILSDLTVELFGMANWVSNRRIPLLQALVACGCTFRVSTSIYTSVNRYFLEDTLKVFYQESPVFFREMLHLLQQLKVPIDMEYMNI
jgi:hypothetical protein